MIRTLIEVEVEVTNDLYSVIEYGDGVVGAEMEEFLHNHEEYRIQDFVLVSKGIRFFFETYINADDHDFEGYEGCNLYFFRDCSKTRTIIISVE